MCQTSISLFYVAGFSQITRYYYLLDEETGGLREVKGLAWCYTVGKPSSGHVAIYPPVFLQKSRRRPMTGWLQ